MPAAAAPPVGELRDLHKIRIARKSVVAQRSLESVQPLLREMELERGPDEADPSVPQPRDMVDRRDEGILAVNVVPGVVRALGGPAVHDKGALELLHQLDARVVLERPRNHEPGDPTRAHEPLDIGQIPDRGIRLAHEQIPVSFVQGFSESGQKLGDERLRVRARLARHQIADGFRGADRQTAGVLIGAIAQLVRGALDPLARGRADVGIVVERSTDRADRQTEIARQSLQIDRFLAHRIVLPSKTVLEKISKLSHVQNDIETCRPFSESLEITGAAPRKRRIQDPPRAGLIPHRSVRVVCDLPRNVDKSSD